MQAGSNPSTPILETRRPTWNGIPTLLGLLLLLAFTVAGLVVSGIHEVVPLILACVVLVIGEVICLTGFFIVGPNQASVLQLFGRYVGSVRQQGLHWANPFFTAKRVSLRVRNFESDKLKVNDRDGNPIEIGAVVVWKVVDSAEAIFEVDDYQHYVRMQSEAALRNLATNFTYDSHEEDEVSLRGNTTQIAAKLKSEVQERLDKAGVEVIEARISHLAYAPEIASAMLQRQQATAIIAARQKIVEGAVGMVEMALESLAQKEVVHLDEERKAAMVSNLLVVLCSDRSVHPVVNTGSLY